MVSEMKEQKNLVIDCGDGGGVIITLNDLRRVIRKEDIQPSELYGPDDADKGDKAALVDPAKNPFVKIP